MPEAGRTDYNELIRFTQLQPGEPYFFIRARDAASGPAVRAWAALALQKGAPAALVESALQQADALVLLDLLEGDAGGFSQGLLRSANAEPAGADGMSDGDIDRVRSARAISHGAAVPELR